MSFVLLTLYTVHAAVCCAAWGCCTHLEIRVHVQFSCLSSFQAIHNAGASLLMHPKRGHMIPILYSFHWFPVDFSFDFQTCVLTYRALNSMLQTNYPSFLLNTLLLSVSITNQKLLVVLCMRLQTRGHTAFHTVFQSKI